jgi:3',5'-cyclic AMP phosphodiesterase CpdA
MALSQGKRLLLAAASFLFVSSCSPKLVSHPYTNEDSVAESPVRLVEASDLHFLSPSLNDHGAFFPQITDSADGKVTGYGEEVLDAFLSEVEAKKPDAFILSGDLTFNGEKASHEGLAQKLEVLRKEGIQPLVIPGNHDIASANTVGFSGSAYYAVPNISKEDFRSLYWSFGLEQASYADSDSFSYVYALRKDLWLLFLDANSNGVDTISEATSSWLKATLAKAQESSVKIIGVSHESLITQSDTLTDRLYSLPQHEEIASMYRDSGVIANLSGHLHIEHHAENGGLYDFATSSLLVSPNQYANVGYDGTTFSYQTQAVAVSEWAKEKGLTDPNLLDFANYSSSFFDSTSRDKVEFVLFASSDPDVYKDAMAYAFVTLNGHYFAGTTTDLTAIQTGLDYWATSSLFFSKYVASMAKDSVTDYRSFSYKK